ncbi:MAG: ribbon-helix-helix protein, CopG family [Candidatus Sumerlaeota bacterium]|nr:ribbon-helix-helix protein, CopG family [Candidatus Sumerlaeota bacterium]
MKSAISISLPDDLRVEIDRVAKAEGVSRSDIVRKAVCDYLFVRRFRALRKTMVAKVSRQEACTDQDVFERMS